MGHHKKAMWKFRNVFIGVKREKDEKVLTSVNCSIIIRCAYPGLSFGKMGLIVAIKVGYLTPQRIIGRCF